MAQSEFSKDVLQRAKWCHLSGLFWFGVLLVCLIFGYLLLNANYQGSLPYEVIYKSWVALGLFFLTLACPFLSSFATAWIYWRTHRSDHPFVDDCGRAATNFQATVSLYGLCAFLLLCFLFLVTCGPMLSSSSWYFNSSPGDEARMIAGLIMLLGGPLLSFIWCLTQILVVMKASTKAMEGKIYVYPWSRQFFS